MAVTRIFLCYDNEAGSFVESNIVNPLFARLQERGLDVVRYPGHLTEEDFTSFAELQLANCQWLVLIQTSGLAALPNVQRVVERALELHERKDLQGILRLTTAFLDDESPREWSLLPTFDGTYDPLRAVERVLLALPSNEPESEVVTRPPVARPPELFISSTYDRPTRPASRLVKFRGSVEGRYHDAMYRYRRFIVIGSIVLLLILIGSTVLVLVQHFRPTQQVSRTKGPTSVPVYGQVTFFSTNLAGDAVDKGIADGVQISLWQIPAPAANDSYYAWLLPDISRAEGTRILAGQLVPANGRASLTYKSPQMTNILASESGLLVTEESAASTPTFPTPDPHKWRYYGLFPQTPSSQDTHHLSALDHLRRLLSSDSNGKISLPGGLGAWLLQNVRLIFQWSSDAWGFGTVTDFKSTAASEDLIAILDTLDGAEEVQQDVPQNTPLLVDRSLYRKPLLSLNASDPVSGYLLEMNSHLFSFASAPGTTPAAQKLAGTINQELEGLQNNLEQIRQDAKAILTRNDDTQLNTLFADLLNQAIIAYTGEVDSISVSRVGGACLIFSQLQQLSQFPMMQYAGQVQI